LSFRQTPGSPIPGTGRHTAARERRTRVRPRWHDVILGRGPDKETALNTLVWILGSIRRDEEGQGLAEYALILALIAVVAIVALIFLGSQVSAMMSMVGTSI
jgi:pilus assembly protein Flp/PilA